MNVGNKSNEKKLYTFFIVLIVFVILFFSTLFRGKEIINILVIELVLILIFRAYKIISANILTMFFYVTIIYFFSMYNSSKASMTTYFYCTIIFFIFNYINFYNYLKKVDDKQILIVLKSIALFGNIIMIYSIFEYMISYNPIFYRFFPEPYHTSYSFKSNFFYRINGSVGHPVPYANLATFIIFSNFILYKITNRKRYIIFFIISCLSLLFTYTRNNYAAVILSIVIICLIEIFKNRFISVRKIVQISIYGVLAIIIIMFLVNSENQLFLRIAERFSNITNDLSYQQRTKGIYYVIDNLVSNPINFLFGYGIGNLMILRELNQVTFNIQNFYALDNQFFTFLYEFGILGIVIIFMYLIKLFEMIKKRRNSYIFTIFCCLLMTLIISEFFYDGIYYWVITNFLISTNVAFLKYFFYNDFEYK